MIHVRVLRGITVAGTAALSLPTLIGCGPADEVLGEDPGVDSQEATASLAGTGTVSLTGYYLDYKSTSGGDEFIRVGEKLKVIVDRATLLSYADVPASATSVSLAAIVRYTHADDSTVDTKEMKLTTSTGAGGVSLGTSPQFTVPKGVKRMQVHLFVDYKDAGESKRVDITSWLGTRDFTVFGAFLPNKFAFFDAQGTTMRTRLIEGGKAVRGAHLTLSVTDWRLDTVVDRSKFDLHVGEQMSGGRFGPVVVPAFGELQYEVEAAISTDSGATYHYETFNKVTASPVFGIFDYGRFTFEKEIAVPSDAGATIKIAYHIKAFLQVPSYSVMNPKYAQGARILLREAWDNNGGQDYPVSVGNK